MSSITAIRRPNTPLLFAPLHNEKELSKSYMLFSDCSNGINYLEALVQLARKNKDAAMAQAKLIHRCEETIGTYPWEEESPKNIDSLFDRVFLTISSYYPQLLTELGLLEVVGLKMHNSYLNDLSPQARKEFMEKKSAILNALEKYPYEQLSEEQKISYKILLKTLQDDLEGSKFLFHEYLFSQLEGPLIKLNQLLTEYHKLETIEDIENYITRLNNVPMQMQGALATLELQARYAITPPKFAIEKVIAMIDKFTEGEVSAQPLYQTLLTKTANLDIVNKEEKLGKARAAIETKVFPALRQIRAHFVELLPTAHLNGAWALPDGDNYYTYALKAQTTTDLTAEQIHELGLKEVASIQAQMRALLAEEGICDEELSLGELIQIMNKKGDFYFPNTPEGKKQCIDEFENILKRCRTQLWPLFNLRPSSAVAIKPVPSHEEEGAAFASYCSPSMDGSRPGIFYVNLHDTKELPIYGMETLAIHEAEPGHHFQLTIQNEMSIPMFRKLGACNAYVEGWALYVEKLAYEEGFYSNNFSKIGHLQDELLRAVRLVVDTGIHRKRWTREQAIDYMQKATGYTEETVISEVERYFVLPGQACSYKIGQLKILELRQRAKDQLGDRFDIKEFHNVVLKIAATPLAILEEVVDDYIKSKKITA